MRIAFHSNQLCLRGTEVALYDYAHHNEKILGNESVIVTHRNAPFHEVKAIEKFAKRFPVYCYDQVSQLDDMIAQSGAELLYCIKAGMRDDVLSKRVPTVVHAVFRYLEPHGHVYAYVSQWLSQYMSQGRYPFVPHMIDLPDDSAHLRDSLDIPTAAVVFGRYGGRETFDLDFAQHAVIEVATHDPQRYFLFLNTQPFGPPLPNVRFLEGEADPTFKVRFINSCDAMLHARRSGETFGLAVGEFSSRNKPVLTWEGSEERAHLELLGSRALRYHDQDSLSTLLREFTPSQEAWDCYSERFNPQSVMQQFRRIFL